MGKGEQLVAIFGILVPIVSVVSVFTFVTFAVWFETRRKEREAFYKSETLRRITESSGEGAKAAIELLREEDRLKRIKAREGLKIGGLVNLGLGVALMIFLRVLVSSRGVYLCGLIPALIGVSLLVYVLYMAAPLEGEGKD
jgi:purine-cytosine permease-like protein